MHIFEKVFGSSDKSDKSQRNQKPDINKLISSENINSSIIELDNYICEYCEYGDRLEKLSEPQKNFFYNQNLEREINNGGFHQFYFNSSGDFANETIESLRAIGAFKTVEIVQKANDQFPDKVIPKDRIQRQEIIERIKDKANEEWEILDQKFFAYEDNLNFLNIEYIRKNKNEF